MAPEEKRENNPWILKNVILFHQYHQQYINNISKRIVDIYIRFFFTRVEGRQEDKIGR